MLRQLDRHEHVVMTFEQFLQIMTTTDSDKVRGGSARACGYYSSWQVL